MEGLTVASIILGTVIGGLLITPSIASVLLSTNLPLIYTAVDASIIIIMLFYIIAAITNLFIPDTGIDHRILKKILFSCFTILYAA